MRKRQTFPTLNHVWIAAALALIALRPLVVPIPPHDFWWHMATGRLIVQSGSIPTVDSFSYMQAGEPFYNQGWLAQVLMYTLHSLGGVPLVLLFQAAVILLAYGLLLWLSIRRSGSVRLAVALLLLTLPLSFDNWNVRPQSYALPLFALFLVILTDWRLRGMPQHSRGLGDKLWLLPLLMIVWVNTHGSFVLGGGLMALTFVGVGAQHWLSDRQARRAGDAEAGQPAARPSLRALFLWGVVTAAAMLVNPRGIGVIGYVFNLLGTSAVTGLVEEWAPPVTRNPTGAVFFLFVIVLVAVLVYARQRPDPIDMLLAGVFFWLALGAERNIIWFVMLVTPLLIMQAATLQPQRDSQPARRAAQGVPAMNAILIGMLALLLLLALPWIKPHLGLPPQIGTLLAAETPVQAVEFIQADPQRPERLYHTMAAGSYLIWAAPEQPVFIDTRIELYPLKQWQDYITLNAGEDVPRLIELYEFDGFLLDNETQPALLAVLQTDPAWEMRYADERHTYLTPRR
jgi:hypothetical protein